jgi:hypothetical protein
MSAIRILAGPMVFSWGGEAIPIPPVTLGLQGWFREARKARADVCALETLNAAGEPRHYLANCAPGVIDR